MNKFLKENWFVALIALILISMTVYFAYDQNKDKLPGKKVGGKQVVFSVDDKNYTADDLYDELYKSYGENDIFLAFQRGVLDAQVPTTDELAEQIDSQVSQAVAYYQQYYGYGEEYLDAMIRYYYGYPSYRDYVTYAMKSDTLYSDYIKAHLDEVLTDELKEKLNGRIISYTVLTVADIDNPTEEEAAKLKEAQDAWASDEYSAANFDAFAAAFSQDSAASNGGKFGYLDSETSGIDETFKAAALALQEGEVSEWIESKDFGYFLIKCDSVKTEDFLEEGDFISNILTASENLSSKILWDAAQQADVKFASEEVEKMIKDSLDLND